MMQSSLLSDIDVALAEVNLVLSKIEVKLSECPNVMKSRSPILPRLGNILSRMESIVFNNFLDISPDPDMSWDDTSHAVWYTEEEEEDVMKIEDVTKEEYIM